MTATRDLRGALAAVRAARTRLRRSREWAQYARLDELEASLHRRLVALADEEALVLELIGTIASAEAAWRRELKRRREAA